MDEMIQRYIDGVCPLCGAENSTEVQEYFYDGVDLILPLYCHKCEKSSHVIYTLESVTPE